MKFIGITLIVVSFSFLGFYFSNKVYSVLKDINRVDMFLKNVLIGLQNENMSIYEIYDTISQNGDENTKKFINSINPKSTKNIAENALECAFCSDRKVLEILREAFAVIGKYPAEYQIKEINFYCKKLENIYESIENETISKAKIIKISGILCGLLTAVIMV